MRIATVNVNGIRAAARKGMGEWLAASAPDILLLQEVRADEQIAVDLLPGYEAAIWPCRIKGRAGVGVAVRDGDCSASDGDFGGGGREQIGGGHQVWGGV